MERVSFVEDVPSKRYRFCEQLGKGADCNVCRAVDRENPGLTYAVRIFRVDISKESEIKALLKIRNEIAVMDICASENIIKHHFSYLYKQSVFMFTEYMDFGSMALFIKKISSGKNPLALSPKKKIDAFANM